MTYLQWKPANGKYQDDDGDQLDNPLLSLHGFYVHSGATKRLLKGEMVSGGGVEWSGVVQNINMILSYCAVYQNLYEYQILKL